MIERYFRSIEALVAGSGSGIIHSSRIMYDKRSTYLGSVRGEIYFVDGSVLHVREFVNVEHGIDRYTYAYHYQDSDGGLIFRYDSAPHFPELHSFPHHKHTGTCVDVAATAPPNLESILQEIQDLASRAIP